MIDRVTRIEAGLKAETKRKPRKDRSRVLRNRGILLKRKGLFLTPFVKNPCNIRRAIRTLTPLVEVRILVPQPALSAF
jgi:hypothetical protein